MVEVGSMPIMAAENRAIGQQISPDGRQGSIEDAFSSRDGSA